MNLTYKYVKDGKEEQFLSSCPVDAEAYDRLPDGGKHLNEFDISVFQC